MTLGNRNGMLAVLQELKPNTLAENAEREGLKKRIIEM